MFTKVTNSIKISVIPEYLNDQSAPDSNYHVWLYTINIENMGQETVQLINRTWEIVDSNGKIQNVHGEGVVGVQPVLNPGEQFEYSSGTHLNTPSGMMYGSYEMNTNDGRKLEIEIPAFSLDSPDSTAMMN